MTKLALIPLFLSLSLSSVGCLTSTPPPQDVASRDPEKTKGTGARDATNATPGSSNTGVGSNTEGGPGSLGEGIGSGSGTGSGSQPGNAGNVNAAPGNVTGPTGGVR